MNQTIFIRLGNSVPNDGGTVSGTLRDTITTFEFPNEPNPEEIALLLNNPNHSPRMRMLNEEDQILYLYLVEVENTWPTHSTQAPAWVESTDARVEAFLGKELAIPVGRPGTWETTYALN